MTIKRNELIELFKVLYSVEEYILIAPLLDYDREDIDELGDHLKHIGFDKDAVDKAKEIALEHIAITR